MLSVFALFLSVSTVNAAVNCTNTINPTIVIAVASNMWRPAQALVDNFGAHDTIQVCHDATGNLLKEINTQNGSGYTSSNYSLFLAANASAPSQVTVYTIGSISDYTTGIPALWSMNASLVNLTNGTLVLSNLTNNATVIIANQSIAPYGLAAQRIMQENTSQWDAVNGTINGTRLLFIEPNIDATYNHIANNQNTAGYVALSQICENGIPMNYSYSSYSSEFNIPQAGVVLDQDDTDKDNLAIDFWYWLISSYSNSTDNAQHILVDEFCYGNITSSSK
jgi:ABC-type molybdate transport system substrate-binding protein